MPRKKLSYNEALQELETILERIQDQDLDVDDLSSNVKRASELLQLCKQKLRATETDVEKILREMEEETEENNDKTP
ncbi:MAG: exodeoxyribonuclease VII small subunit [Bacteroidales bacterium]